MGGRHENFEFRISNFESVKALSVQFSTSVFSSKFETSHQGRLQPIDKVSDAACSFYRASTSCIAFTVTARGFFGSGTSTSIGLEEVADHHDVAELAESDPLSNSR